MHIPIRAPKENHEDYFNRKDYFSFVVQGILKASGAYLSVPTGFPGSMHDASVLRLSHFCKLAEEKRILTMLCIDINGTQIRPLILGHSAYPPNSWLMRPFGDNGALTATLRQFNKELNKYFEEFKRLMSSPGGFVVIFDLVLFDKTLPLLL